MVASRHNHVAGRCDRSPDLALYNAYASLNAILAYALMHVLAGVRFPPEKVDSGYAAMVGVFSDCS